MSRFAGFGSEVHDWFKGLEADNSKEYFAANRAFFQQSIRAQMEALLTELTRTFGGEVKMFRQNRGKPHARRDARLGAGHQPHRRSSVRQQNLAFRGTRDRLARPACWRSGAVNARRTPHGTIRR